MDTGPSVRIGVLLAVMVAVPFLVAGVLKATARNVVVGIPLIVIALSVGFVTWALVHAPRKRVQ